jgi:hypothetical protein
MLVDLVHYRTGAVFETQRVWDPFLRWERAAGGWELKSWVGGQPDPAWVAANPPPQNASWGG